MNSFIAISIESQKFSFTSSYHHHLGIHNSNIRVHWVRDKTQNGSRKKTSNTTVSGMLCRHLNYDNKSLRKIHSTLLNVFSLRSVYGISCNRYKKNVSQRGLYRGSAICNHHCRQRLDIFVDIGSGMPC